MVLPRLNTEGIDITNTLLNIDRGKTAKLQREIMAQQNALLKTKNRVELYNHAREGLNWTIAAVDAGDESAYNNYKEHMINMGIPSEALPDSSIFYDEKDDISAEGRTKRTPIFNKERYKEWATRAMMVTADLMDGKGDQYTTKTLYGPDNKTRLINIKKGEDYTPEKDWSFTKPETEEKVSVKDTFKNPAGDTVTLMSDGKYMVGKREASEAELKGIKKIGTETSETGKTDKTKSNRKRLTDLDLKLTKVDKDGNLSRMLVDKNAGATVIEEYNQIAEDTGSKYRYVWKDKVFDSKKDYSGFTGTLKELKDTLKGESKTEKIGGYVKVEEGAEEEEETDALDATIKAKVEAGDFTMDEPLLEEYRKLYPDRPDEEIKEAFKNFITK